MNGKSNQDRSADTSLSRIIQDNINTLIEHRKQTANQRSAQDIIADQHQCIKSHFTGCKETSITVTDTVFIAHKSEVIGITPIGRATIVKLKLNRSGVKNLRVALKKLGLHPPE